MAASSDRFCANCSVFDWPQAAAGLKRCARCRVLWYCGRPCQEEHWDKVHKHHCRHLASPATAQTSLHTTSCAACRQVAAAGEEIRSPANPTFPCIDRGLEYTTAALTSPQPFPLTGVPGDREEKAIILLMKFGAKMGVTRGPIGALQQRKLMSLLFKGRVEMWGRRKIYPQAMGHGRDDSELFDEVLKMEAGMAAIRIQKLVNDDQLHLWTMFSTVFYLLQDYNKLRSQRRLRSPLASVAREHHHLLHRAEAGGFDDIFDRVLDLLGDQLAPYSELVRAVCGGSLERSCGFCDRAVTVAEVLAGSLLGVPQVAALPTAAGLVSCNQGACAGQLKEKMVENNQWCLALVSPNSHMCDNCYQNVPIQAIHRCNHCRKKQYCSRACLEQDQAAGHTAAKLCRKEGEERKVKGGRRERVEERREEVRRTLTKAELEYNATVAGAGAVAGAVAVAGNPPDVYQSFISKL